MQGSLKVRVVSTLQRAGLDKHTDEIGGLFARYVCRLSGSRYLRKRIRILCGDEVDACTDLILVKEDLDFSVTRNKLLRATQVLSNARQELSEYSVIQVARQLNVEAEDLFFLYTHLSREDLGVVSNLELASRDDGYSDTEVLKIIRQTEPVMRGLVNRKLMFALSNDPMLESAEDLVSPLRVQAMRIIREYEIEDITYDHMLHRVIKGIQNAAYNLAWKYGRDKRCPIIRVSAPKTYREAWHFDIKLDRVHPIHLYPDQGLRRNINGRVLTVVMDPQVNQWIVVQHKRLYATEDEAYDHRDLFLAGLGSKRGTYLEPSDQHFADFHRNVVSLDNNPRGNDDDSAKDFHEIVPDTTTHNPFDDERRMRDVLNKLPPRTRDFAQIIFSAEVDELFDAWCEENGYDTQSCTYTQLGRLACKYLGVSKSQLRADLSTTPTGLWNANQKNLILDGINAH